MSDELAELEEHAEHGREHPDLAPVTLTMAVLAVLVAAVSLPTHTPAGGTPASTVDLV